MKYIVVDVESDNPSPANGSMICFGAIFVADMSKTFYGKTAPITDLYNPETLAISNFTREEHLKFDDPKIVMQQFNGWILKYTDRPIFISDNNGYDWQWINFYFHKYLGKNPFGFSSRRIGDLYCGMKKDSYAKWKHLRKTIHTHNPVDDAKGNAEALLEMQKMGLNIRF